MRKLNWFFLALMVSACASAPHFNSHLARPWQSELENEYPSKKPWVAHHKHGNYELFYLAAHHDNNPQSETHHLVEKLFHDFQFNVLVIEPFSYSLGESPEWFLKEGTKGDESFAAASLAFQKKIPFFGGEIDHRKIFRELKSQSYQDIDILGFYLTRQIPQWIRSSGTQKGLIERKAPKFIQHYCKEFDIAHSNCPSLINLQSWFRLKTGNSLGANINTEDVAPLHESPKFLHQISSSIGKIRDRFTLKLIEKILAKHQRVAVVYGASHYMTLQKSFEKELGPAVAIISP